jgi:hypothetical protein
VAGKGLIYRDPLATAYSAGTTVTLQAVPAYGYQVTGWSGDASGTGNPITVTMNGNKNISVSFAHDMNLQCANPVSITLPFEYAGDGEYCWITSGDIEFTNTHHVDAFIINGVDFAGMWSNEMPPRIDGLYYIYYRSTTGVGSTTIGGTGGNTGTTPDPTATPSPTLVGQLTPASTPEPGILGDVNNNGSIEIVDALLTAQYYVELNPAGFNAAFADTDCDGDIDIVDALLIARYYVKLITQFC